MKDLLGAALSGLCAIHCAASVLFVAGGGTGLFAVFLASEWAHTVFAAFAVLFAAMSFPAALRRHGQMTPPVAGTTGIVLLLAGLVAPESLEMPFTVVGAGLAAFAHLWNRRLITQLEVTPEAA